MSDAEAAAWLGLPWPPSRATPDNHRAGAVVPAAQGGEITALQEMLRGLREDCEDLRRERDHWRELAKGQQAEAMSSDGTR